MFNSNYIFMYEAVLLKKVSVGTLAVTVWHRPSPRAWEDPLTIRTRTLMIKVNHFICLCLSVSFSVCLFFFRFSLHLCKSIILPLLSVLSLSIARTFVFLFLNPTRTGGGWNPTYLPTVFSPWIIKTSGDPYLNFFTFPTFCFGYPYIGNYVFSKILFNPSHSTSGKPSTKINVWNYCGIMVSK